MVAGVGEEGRAAKEAPADPWTRTIGVGMGLPVRQWTVMSVVEAGRLADRWTPTVAVGIGRDVVPWTPMIATGIAQRRTGPWNSTAVPAM